MLVEFTGDDAKFIVRCFNCQRVILERDVRHKASVELSFFDIRRVTGHICEPWKDNRRAISEVWLGVATTLEDSLGVSEEQVIEMAKIKEDLGAESIDFLDITFKLEKRFGIKIPRGALDKVFTVKELIEYVRTFPQWANK